MSFVERFLHRLTSPLRVAEFAEGLAILDARMDELEDLAGRRHSEVLILLESIMSRQAALLAAVAALSSQATELKTATDNYGATILTETQQVAAGVQALKDALAAALAGSDGTPDAAVSQALDTLAQASANLTAAAGNLANASVKVGEIYDAENPPAPAPVPTVGFTLAPTEVMVGDRAQVLAQASDGSQVMYSTGDISIAVIEGDEPTGHFVKGVSVGTVNILAKTANGGLSDYECEIS